MERLRNLEAEIRPSFFAKRNDPSSSYCGGNKVRKLEFTLADDFRRGCRMVMTMGAPESNHVLTTAAHGRRLGLQTVATLFANTLDPLDLSPLVREEDYRVLPALLHRFFRAIFPGTRGEAVLRIPLIAVIVKTAFRLRSSVGRLRWSEGIIRAREFGGWIVFFEVIKMVLMNEMNFRARE